MRDRRASIWGQHSHKKLSVPVWSQVSVDSIGQWPLHSLLTLTKEEAGDGHKDCFVSQRQDVLFSDRGVCAGVSAKVIWRSLLLRSHIEVQARHCVVRDLLVFQMA